ASVRRSLRGRVAGKLIPAFVPLQRASIVLVALVEEILGAVPRAEEPPRQRERAGLAERLETDRAFHQGAPAAGRAADGTDRIHCAAIIDPAAEAPALVALRASALESALGPAFRRRSSGARARVS